VLIPVVAMVAFGGDQEALVRTAIGEIEVAPSDQVASLDPIVADAVARSEGAVIQSIGLDRWRTDDANATVRLVRETPLGSTNLNYIYDGHTGDFLYDKPGIGTVPSVGSAAVDLMGKLHFGTLFGIVTKLLWGGFGLATCLIAVAGLAIYVLRQREETRATQFVRTMTVVASAGIPMASAATALAWVVSLSTGVVDPEPVLTATFLGVIATSAGLALVRPFTAALGDGWAASGLALIGLVVAAPLATGLGWAEVWADVELRETLWVDGALLVAALSLGAMSFAIRRARPQDAREQVVPTPAGAEEDAVLSGAGLT
ncbi:MAG: PepSY-associated TM helix domain-containing protein, partial [Myxococcota bacterium]